MQNALPPRALLGTSAAVLGLRADTRLAEESDAQVLITGEPGVGKHALALLIHSRSTRQRDAFHAIDIAGLPEIVVSRQVFGQNGAAAEMSDDRGLLRAARRGTLFIDSVDTLTPTLQSRLSRVLEVEDSLGDGSREEEWDAFDVRIIVGAAPTLYDQVREGRFRDELFYRINVIHLVVPPLRERIDDLPAHLHDVLTAYAETEGTEPPEVSDEALSQLRAYEWPGNDRELDQVARLLVRRGTSRITPKDLPPELTRR
jgi:DNA-binding NtrC family response regulator